MDREQKVLERIILQVRLKITQWWTTWHSLPGLWSGSQWDKDCMWRYASVWGVTALLLGAALLWLERVAEGRGECGVPWLIIHQDHILHVPALESPAADLHHHLPPLKGLEGLLGSHGARRRLVTPVARAQIDCLAAQLAHLALALGARRRQVGDVLQGHEYAAEAGLGRLHAAAQHLKVVQVGPPEATLRHKLPGHGLVQPVEEGLVCGRGVGCRGPRGLRCPFAVTIIRAAFGSLPTTVWIPICTITKHQRSIYVRLPLYGLFAPT